MNMGLARGYVRTALLIAISIANQACATSSSTSGPLEDPEPPTVTCCDLLAHPERFDKKTVRIRALLDHSHFQQVTLDNVNGDDGKPHKVGAALGKIWLIEQFTTQRPQYDLFE